MRPIAVLILILGAISALAFAILSITNDSDGGREPSVVQAAPVVSPATGPGNRPPVLTDPDQPIAPATALDGDRTALGDPEGTGAWPNQLRGKVIGPQGQPLRDASVKLIKDAASSDFNAISILLSEGTQTKPTKVHSTDKNGEFTFRGLEPGKRWSVIVEHPMYMQENVGPYDIPESGTVDDTIRLAAGRGLFGYVRSKTDGLPIEGAVIALDNPITPFLPAGKASSERQETLTDDQGHYEFLNVNPGQRALTAKAEGYATMILTQVQFDDSLRNQQDLDMEVGQFISGRVVAPDGTGIVGAQIEALCHGDVSSAGRAISTEDGAFQVADLAENVYTMRVRAQGWDFDQIPRVESGQEDVEIQAIPLGGVMGRVVDANTGRPLRSFTAKVRMVHKNKKFGAVILSESFRNAEDGKFLLTGVKPGLYLVQADAKGYAATFSEQFLVSEGSTTPDVEVAMTKGGLLRGQVVDATSGEPIAGARISTFENNWVDSEFTRLFQGTMEPAHTKVKLKTDAEGRFEIRLMKPETYQVQFNHQDFVKITKNNVIVGDGLETNLGQIQLVTGGVVRGTVFGAGGRAAPGAKVFLHPMSGNPWGQSRMEGKADADGKFLMRNVSPGNYKLSAAKKRRERGSSPFDIVLDTQNSEVEISIAEGGEYNQDLYLGED